MMVEAHCLVHTAILVLGCNGDEHCVDLTEVLQDRWCEELSRAAVEWLKAPSEKYIRCVPQMAEGEVVGETMFWRFILWAFILEIDMNKIIW